MVMNHSFVAICLLSQCGIPFSFTRRKVEFFITCSLDDSSFSWSCSLTITATLIIQTLQHTDVYFDPFCLYCKKVVLFVDHAAMVHFSSLGF